MATRESAGQRARSAARHHAREADARAQSGSGWYAWTARTGLVAKGLSFGLVGALAIALAAGAGGKATSREGALESLTQYGLGKLVLVLLAIGFAAYAVWRLVQAVAERCDDEEATEQAKTWGRRAGYVGRGVIYAALTFSTVKLLVGSGANESQTEKAHHTTATVFDWPGGRWLVGLAGLVIVGAGLWNVYRGVARRFEDDWRVGKMSGVEKTWGGRAGVAGHVARGVVFCLIGVFVVKAAIEYDPKDAIGLDGALRKLAHASYGPYLLGITAFGLICYGVYCLVDARLCDVSANGGGG